MRREHGLSTSAICLLKEASWEIGGIRSSRSCPPAFSSTTFSAVACVSSTLTRPTTCLSHLRLISTRLPLPPSPPSTEFQRDYLTDYNDTLLAVYLGTMTKGINSANEIVDKFSLAYEKSSRRRPI